MSQSQIERVATPGDRLVPALWGVALGILFLTQLLIFVVATPWGNHAIPQNFSMGFVKAGEARGLIASTRSAPNATGEALARQIAATVPADRPLELVRYPHEANLITSDLAYSLYPRMFSQRAGVPGDVSPRPGCRIDLLPDSVVTLSCTGSDAVWRYPAPASDHQ